MTVLHKALVNVNNVNNSSLYLITFNAEVAAAFAIGFGSSALQQGIDNGVWNINWRQALEGGVRSAIASALPPLKIKKWRTGRCR